MDVSDLDYYINKEPIIKAICYPIGFFERSEDFGDSVLIKDLKSTKEDVWYLVRVHDIDLSIPDYVGQIVFKTKSKSEAVLRWEKDAEDKLYPGLTGRYYYIFNPSKIE